MTNPIDEWQKARIVEVADGGKATICIMGCDDYAALMGALSVLYGISPIGANGSVNFQNVEIMKSYGSKNGIMFA
jgi:hypothetical protein